MSSPFLGILIDKIGKRVILIILSAFILLAAHLMTMFLPNAADGTTSYAEVAPLVLIGVGFC